MAKPLSHIQPVLTETSTTDVHLVAAPGTTAALCGADRVLGAKTRMALSPAHVERGQDLCRKCDDLAG